MMTVNLEANIKDPDAFYDELLLAHDGLTTEESNAMNARLILILSNHIGDRQILSQAIKVAANGKA